MTTIEPILAVISCVTIGITLVYFFILVSNITYSWRSYVPNCNTYNDNVAFSKLVSFSEVSRIKQNEGTS